MPIRIILTFLFLQSSYAAFSLNTPTGLNPQNGVSMAGYSVVISASAVTTATGYEFYVDTVSTFNSGWLKHDTATYHGWSTPDLKVGKTYYWKMRAFKPGDTSAWTATRSFSTTQPQIAYFQPSTGTSGNVRTFWANPNGGSVGTTVQYEADTTALFNSPLHTIATSLYYVVNGLSDSVLFDFGRKIYWRARAWNTYGDTTLWTSVSNYTIIKQAPIGGTSGNLQTHPQYIVTWTDPYLAGTEVQIDTAATFNTTRLMIHTVAGGILRDTVKNLMFGDQYYIRIRNTYAGKVSDWSVTRMVKIYATYNFIEPSFPGDISSYYGTCGWSSGTGFRTQFGLYEDDQYTILLKDTITSAFSYSYPEMLKFSKRFYVRIRMFHELDTTPWTNSNFIVSAGTPTIYGVTNNATNVIVRPRFSLRRETWATGYVMEIDTGKLYTTSHSPFYIKSDTFTYDNSFYHYMDTSLLYNQQYYVRLYALKGNDTTGAALVTFKTASAPVNYFPPNNMIGTGTSTDGLVTGIKGSTYIQWETDTSALFNSLLYNSGVDQHIPDDFTPQYVGVSFPDYLNFHSTYYWRARCINPVDTGEWSAPFKFLTTQDVWGISPADNAVAQSITPTLEWGIQGSSNSLRYQYIVYTDSGFAGASVITLPEDSFSRVKISCQFATTYYWKARAFNPVDTSRWSKAFSFTTIPLPAVGKPTLQSPSNGALNVTPGTVSLFWSNAANANSYDAEVASDVNFTNILASGSATSTGIYFSGAEPSTRYYWHVRGAYNANIKGAWSTTFWFQTTPPVGLEDVSTDTQATVFPNPASDRVMIHSAGSFEVTVTDLQGRTVKDQKGNDELLLETADLNQGVYFISVQSGEKMLVQKLVISR